jgi:hypothetical protein
MNTAALHGGLARRWRGRWVFCAWSTGPGRSHLTWLLAEQVPEPDHAGPAAGCAAVSALLPLTLADAVVPLSGRSALVKRASRAHTAFLIQHTVARGVLMTVDVLVGLVLGLLLAVAVPRVRLGMIVGAHFPSGAPVEEPDVGHWTTLDDHQLARFVRDSLS